MSRLKSLTIIAAIAGFALCGYAADRPKTLVYDGFATGGKGGTYRNHNRLAASSNAIAETVGIEGGGGWSGSTSHFRTRWGRKLKHSLVEKLAGGSLGHWTFNGHRALGRKLPVSPTATTGVYTLCLLYHAHDNIYTRAKGVNGHTTNFKDAYAMIGFVPQGPPIDGGARGGNSGQKGLSIGFFEDDLRVFAGGNSFTIVETYKMGVTYLLMAEMTVDRKGEEYIRGFYAIDGEKKLTPAKFNEENSGKGVKVETWSSTVDMTRMQIYTQDTNLSPPQASNGDHKQRDFVTWDEVRLLDGKATVPVPHIPAASAASPDDKYLIAEKTLPAKLAAYWPLDEGKGESTGAAIGKMNGKFFDAKWVKDGLFGSAVNFSAKQGPKYGPHFATAVSFPHEAVVDAGAPWERNHPMTLTAWVRGGDDFKKAADIITKCDGASAAERSAADIKGIAFMITGGQLELELINSVTYSIRDNRIKVLSDDALTVPGDNKWHHVAVTYDGASKAAGITFYVDGVKGEKNNVIMDQLSRDVAVVRPYCLGGRARWTKEDRVSAGASNYAMIGDIDEAGVFSYALAPGYVTVIHSLATTKSLAYTLDKVNQLIELHRGKRGSVKIGDRTWIYATGLKGDLGKVAREGDVLSVKLAEDGSGVKAK